ncbi:hypothetical protein A9Q99_21000 [Gammaproteobacteria bacterium 45_16_T64]|nr:hypothetical protein A9Q99_21000 [Gammaproteobacteria bacterium 45_16_T64]
MAMILLRRWFLLVLVTLVATLPMSVGSVENNISTQNVAVEGPGLLSTLEEVLHVVNEIGQYFVDFYEAIRLNPLEGVKSVLVFFAELLGLVDAGDGEGELVFPGPGIGNNTYVEGQLFEPLGWVDHKNGVPGLYPGRKPFGTNLAMMIDGYFFTLFAPDSGQGPGGFLFLDVSDPSKPTLAKRVYEPDGITGKLREPHSFGMARINGRRYMSFQNTIGIEIWDFTDLNHLVRVSELALPNVDAGDYSNVSWQLSWQAPYLYVAGSEQGLFIVDVVDPGHPVLANRGQGEANPIPPSELGGFRIGPLFTFGNQLIVSSMENRDGISSLDISDPLHPQLLDKTSDLEQLYYSTCFNGEVIAASVRGSGARMVLYDLNEPERIAMSSNHLEVDGQLYCAFQDEYIFQGAEDRVHKIDISDPGNPNEVGSGTLIGTFAHLVDHGQISPLGNLVFVGNDHGTGSALMPHSLSPDRRPPEVVVTSPRDRAVGQSTMTRIGIAFSDVVDFSSVNEDSIRLLDAAGQQVSGTYSIQNNIVHLAPSAPLSPSQRYSIYVVGNHIRDVVGNTLSDDYVAYFDTGEGVGYLDVDVAMNEATISVAEVGEVVLFDVDKEGVSDTFEYRWDMGDGHVTGFSDSSELFYEYDSPGHYQITLTVREGGKTKRIMFTKTVIRPVTTVPPTKTSTIVADEATAYVVNPDNNTVTAIDLSSMVVSWEVDVGLSPQTLSIDRKGNLWVTLQEEDKIVILSNEGKVIDSINLSYGAAPFGIVFSPNKDFALVSLFGANRLIKLSESKVVIGDVAITSPRAIAIDALSSRAWVTRMISNEQEGQVYALDLSAGLEVISTVPLPIDSVTVDSQDRARGVPNYLFDIAVSPDGDSLAVPSKKDNILRGQFRDGNNLDHDKTIRALLSTIGTSSGRVENDLTIDFDNRSAPRAVVYSPLGDYVFTALQGSNKVIVTDAFSRGIRVELPTGLAPQGMLLVNAGATLLVHNFMSRSLSIFDVEDLVASRSFGATLVKEVALVSDEKLTPEVLQGKQIFYNADDPRMSRESYLSCASCHIDGGHDGMVWDFHERGEGLRNTISMKGKAGTHHGNVHWTANFDEIQDFEHDIRDGFGGTGFLADEQFEKAIDPLGEAKEGMSVELDSLSRYAESLDSFGRSPYRNDGVLSEKAVHGKAIFEALSCSDCHSGDKLADGRRHLLDTLIPGSGSGMGEPLMDVGVETPTLLGLWESAPYLHHGLARTIGDVLQTPGHGGAQQLIEEDMEALEHFLLSLDRIDVAEPTSAIQFGNKLRNMRWGCANVSGAAVGDVVFLDLCDNSVRWAIDGDQIRLASDPALCIEWNRWSLGWSRFYLSSCDGDIEQHFYLDSAGKLRIADSPVMVLDAFGSSSGAKIGAWWNKVEGLNQRWLLD